MPGALSSSLLMSMEPETSKSESESCWNVQLLLRKFRGPETAAAAADSDPWPFPAGPGFLTQLNESDVVVGLGSETPSRFARTAP